MSRVLKNSFVLIAFSMLMFPAFSQNVKESNYLLGKAFLESGDNDSALVYLDKAQKEKVNDPNIFFNKGLALFNKAQYAMAIREFEQVEKISKGKASIWLARSYANLRDTENSLKALEIHLTSNYRLPESTILLDPSLKIIENEPEYIEFWKTGDWYSGLDEVLAEAGYLIKSRNYPEAINVLSEGIKKGYRKAPIYAKRAEVYLAVSNYKLALDDLNQSIELDSRNPVMLAQRANILYLTGKYKPSLDDYNAAIKLNPDELRYYVGRAMSAGKSGLYDAAVNDMNIYLSYYPGNDTAWFQFGRIHFENENYFEAIDCFNKALKINQGDARYFALRGATYLQTRTYQYAWKDLSMALDLNPNDSQTYLNKGIAAVNTGKSDDACFCFEMAKKMGNRDAFTYAEKYCK